MHSNKGLLSQIISQGMVTVRQSAQAVSDLGLVAFNQQGKGMTIVMPHYAFDQLLVAGSHGVLPVCDRLLAARLTAFHAPDQQLGQTDAKRDQCQRRYICAGYAPQCRTEAHTERHIHRTALQC